MNVLNTAMPEAARRAYEQAHQRRGTRKAMSATRRRKQPDRDAYLKDERKWLKMLNERNRGYLARKTEIVLENQRTPRLTAQRLDILRAKDTANRIRAQRARTPERRRAEMQRHMNTVCHSIWKDKGLRK